MNTISIYESNPRLLSVLRFTFPTVIMMVFASMYGIIDGIFLANFIGSKALSANNIVYPLITVCSLGSPRALHLCSVTTMGQEIKKGSPPCLK